jgi:glycosyltransferase involved in cell wall biosynthesis
MAKITALVHTHNDEQRIGRALDSLRACDEVLVIDHGSTDRTRKVAGQHGAEVKKGVPGVNPGVYAIDARHDWIFCLLPTEALSEALEASLFEWKDRQDQKSDDEDKNAPSASSCSVRVREETAEGWKDLPPETRLVNRKKVNWPEHLPPNDPNSEPLAGDVLRFANP